MLEYEYIKNHYRLIAVDLSRKKEVDVAKAMASVIDDATQNNVSWVVIRQGKRIILDISNEDMDQIVRIIKSLEEWSWKDGVSEAVKYKIKKQEGWFPGMLLKTLRASLLGNVLKGKEVMRAGKGVTRAGSKCDAMNHLSGNI